MDETQIRSHLDEAVKRGANADQIKELHSKLNNISSEPKEPEYSVGGDNPNAVTRGFLKGGLAIDQLLDKAGVGQKLGLPSYDQLSGAGKKLDKQGEGKGFLSGLGEVAGNPVNVAAMAFPGGRIANAAAGAASKLSEPVSGENFALKKTKQGIEGALEGFLGGEAAQSLGKLVSPQFSKAVSLLSKEGVSMTPGTLASGVLKGAVKRGEDALSSIPVIGSFVRDAQNKSLEDFNKAAVNRVLSPLKTSLPKGVKAGRDAIEHAKDAIGNAYDKVKPHISFSADPDFVMGLRKLKVDSISTLTGERQKQFEDIFNSIVGHRLGNKGSMDGETFKRVESQLGTLSRSYAKSNDADQKFLGQSIDKLRGLMRDQLVRSNPKYADQLSNINKAFAGYIRVRDASIRTIKSGEREIGVFSPTDLLRDIKSKETKGSFASGDGLLQDLAEAGSQVLPSTISDSGTMERGLWAMLAGGGATVGHPGATAAAVAGTLPYTRPGMATTNLWAQKANNPNLRKLIEGMAPAAGVAAAQIPTGAK